MQPEKGNPLITVTRQDICRAFLDVGTVPGDLVVYHGSLSSMGQVAGGAISVAEGILQATAPGGTAASPTLWYNGEPGRDHPADFNPETSPAYNGALPEALRLDPRSCRSNHFSHAVSAIGARARELTATHGDSGPAPSPWSEKAFAEDSPWQKIYAWNALYAFIGVDMTVCTLKHFIESRYIMRLLAPLPPELQAARRAELGADCNRKLWPFYNSGEVGRRLLEMGIARQSRIGSATLLAVRSRPLVEVTTRLFSETPQAWFNPEFLAWGEETTRLATRTTP